MLSKVIKPLISFNTNVSPKHTFLGTNCFLIGGKDKRVLIDTGNFPEVDSSFIPRLDKYLTYHKCRVNKIFITHGVKNHFGGV
jgi:mRNA degradation ribonuclease J1/J2